MVPRKQILRSELEQLTGRPAPRSYTIIRLKQEIKRVKMLISSTTRHYLDEQKNFNTNPTAKVLERLSHQDIHPDPDIVTRRAIEYIRRQKNPKKAQQRDKKMSLHVRARLRGRRVRVMACRRSTECPPARPKCRNGTCIRID